MQPANHPFEYSQAGLQKVLDQFLSEVERGFFICEFEGEKSTFFQGSVTSQDKDEYRLEVAGPTCSNAIDEAGVAALKAMGWEYSEAERDMNFWIIARRIEIEDGRVAQFAMMSLDHYGLVREGLVTQYEVVRD